MRIALFYTLCCFLIFIPSCTTLVPPPPTVMLSVPAVVGAAPAMPVSVEITLPESLSGVPLAEIAVTLKDASGSSEPMTGQLLPGKSGGAELWWILPGDRAAEAQRYTAVLEYRPDRKRGGFSWRGAPGADRDLFLGGRRVFRYVHAYDPSTPERLHETYKPYYHLYDLRGARQLTKGAGGLYTHHRGVFLGWNKVTHDGKTYDFWHMKNVVQRHVETLEETAGPIAARLRTKISWDDPDGEPVLVEEREVVLIPQPESAGLLLEFTSTLTAPSGPVTLDGDPEHAGFQFRPHNGLADAEPADQAVYLFHEPEIDPKTEIDLPWAAMTFKLDGRSYAVQHMNHGMNPKGTIYSAYRDYGRFGAFPRADVAPGEPLTLRYRIFVQAGGLPSVESCDARHRAFVDAPQVEVIAAEGKQEGA